MLFASDSSRFPNPLFSIPLSGDPTVFSTLADTEMHLPAPRSARSRGREGQSANMDYLDSSSLDSLMSRLSALRPSRRVAASGS